MTTDTLHLLIATRLEDFADRVDFLLSQGMDTEADLLRQEGLALAEAYDREETFFVLNVASV